MSLLRGRRKADGPAAGSILKRPAGTPLPLSLAQQRLWFLARMEPTGTVYNVALAATLDGPLDVEALRAALLRLGRRHLTLRTRFPALDGHPHPEVADQLDLDLLQVDLRDGEPKAREYRIGEIAEERLATPFDLARDHPFRSALILETDRHGLLLMVFHHIATDGWSRQVLFRDLEALYRAECDGDGGADPLPELIIDYGDFAAWQRAQMADGGLDEQIRYWTGRLGQGLSTLGLPTDHARPSPQTYEGAVVSFEFQQEPLARLGALCRARDATLFMGLLAVFKILLGRYCYQTDIPIGTAVANRTREEVEPLVGFFVNTLVMRTELDGADTFDAVLDRVRETALGAYANQDVPFEKLVEILNPSRDTSRNPLFQVFFNLVDVPGKGTVHPVGEDSVRFNRIDFPHRRVESKFDLTLDVRPHAEGHTGRLVFNRDLFEPESVEAFAVHYQCLLRQVSGQPDAPLAELDAGIGGRVGPSEPGPCQLRPVPGHGSLASIDPSEPLAHRFDDVVRLCGRQMSIESGEASLSYDDLSRWVRRIADCLNSAELPAGQPVALLFGQSTHGPAAMLGALYAGQTFVAMDPSHPAERLAYMLEDSGAGLLLTDRDALHRVEGLQDQSIRIALIEEVLGAAGAEFDRRPTRSPPKAGGYLLYTSGSTGQPKAVIQNASNLMHFMRVYSDNLRIGAGDRLAWISSFAFDATLMDVFGGLLSGATLVPFDLKQCGLGSLLGLLRQSRITVFHSTPTVFRTLCAILDKPESLPELRLVVLGGEETRPSDVALFQRHFPEGCILVNGYGPTEASVCLQQLIDHRFQPLRGIPMGTPMPGIEIELRAPDGAPAPRMGEITLRSRYIARGYLNRPEQTAAAFIAHSDDPDERRYLTGDLAEFRTDCQLVYRGRKDFQVKVRGQRVECGEVEAVLASLGTIDEAAVTAVEDADGNTRLVAHVLPADPEHFDADAAVESLAHRLPEFMVPGTLVALDALPRTPNGKLDRRALPDPIAETNTRSDGRMEPATEPERILQEIWATLLDTSTVPLDRSFFELGGHSLLAVRLFWEIEQRFERNLPLSTLYRAPSIETLALEVTGTKPTGPWNTLVEIRAGTDERPFFCVHGIAGNVLFVRALAERLTGRGPFYGLQPPMLDGSRCPFDSVESVAAHYLEAVRAVQRVGPYRLGGFSFGGTVALEMARQLARTGEQIERLVIFDSKAPRGGPPASVSHDTRAADTPGISALRQTVRRIRRANRELQREIRLRGPRLLHRALAESFLLRNRPVPVRLRSFYIAAMFSELARRYRGRATEVPVLLLCSPGRRERLSADWRAFANGPLDIRSVPGKHKRIFDEDNVEQLAEALEPFLG